MCDKIQQERETRGAAIGKIDDCYSESDSQAASEKDLLDRGYGYEKSGQYWPPGLSDWCPRASMYYAYTEDTNPFDRVEEFIESEQKSGEKRSNQMHFDPPLDPFTIRDPFEENVARAKYLEKEPVSFVIFGKPGLGSHRLAKLIADWWKCVLISPESLIHDEIQNDTDKGWWLTKMRRKGEALSLNILMNLMNSRIEKRDVMHRGYVVEGLPFIPEEAESEISTCPEDVSLGKETCCASGPCVPESKTTSSSTFSTGSFDSLPLTFDRRGDYELDARIKLLHRTTIQENSQEVKNVASIDARENPFTLENDAEELHEKCKDYIPQQIDMIFQSWPVKPTVIIYVACPDEDLDGCLENREFDPVVETNNSKRWGTVEGQFDDEVLEKKLITRTSIVTSLQTQCQLYKRYALPVIERYVLLHNPQNVIRVEGRTTLSQIFEVVSTKLRSLPLVRSIIPQRIWEHDEMSQEQEEEEEEEEFENEKTKIPSDGTMDEAFERLAKKSTVSSKFPWSLSRWKYLCPVEMAMGRKVEGKVELTVRFMNKIFFLSSEEWMERFIENPRPFLVSMEPRPICRIAIFGPTYCGKSELSESLARKFLANVIDVRELVKEMTDERRDANIAEAMREAYDRVVDGLRIRLEYERRKREIERNDALDSWFHEAREILQRFDEIGQADSSEEEAEDQEYSDGEFLRRKLHEYGLEAFGENHELLETARNNEMIIYEYAPHELRHDEPPVRELSEHDPEVAAILENEVKHLLVDNIVITNDEIARCLISRISMIADEQIDGELSRQPGCIVDGLDPDPEIWEILLEAGVVFDDLILITEEPPYGNLIRSWKRYYDAKNGSGESTIDDQYIEDFKKNKIMQEYIRDLNDFTSKWQLFASTLKENGTVPLICKFDETTNVYEAVVKHISTAYRFEAKVISDEERAREIEDTIDSVTETDKESEEDWSREEELEESKSKNLDPDNRSFGDTGIYCPVALARGKVLWKGKSELAASFLDKIYLCSSAEALNDFVKSPEAFNVPFKKPVTEGPFARICIVGPPGSGKSTLAKFLSTDYGMIHVDFANRLDNFSRDPRHWEANDRSGHDDALPLAIVQKYKEEGATLPERILVECFLNYFKNPYTNSAIVFDSFPNCLEDVHVMINNYTVPEVVIELECSLDKAQERLLPGLLEAFAKEQETGKNIPEEGKEEEEEDGEIKEEENEQVDEEEVRDRLLREIRENHERRNEMLDKARMRMEEESIPWIIVDADKDLDILKQNLRKIVRPLIDRESPPLESTYQLNPYKADDLLECGYYLLSSFGRSCPVQTCNRENPFQMYLPMDERDEIYPILHRHYIYMLAGEEASKKFRKDPLKYISQDSCNVVIPAKISIVGPPKCGKTTLAERFARAYGLRVINREDALTRIRKNYSWTKTAIEIEQLLQSNENVTKKLFARVVELYCSDYRSCTQGFVLDGFPSDQEEMEELILLNIKPMMVINLQADRGFCLESITNDEATSRKIVQQSMAQISRRYAKWQSESSSFLDWLRKLMQNVVDVNATGSKWAVWRESDRYIRSRFADIKRYFREADYEKVHSLKSLAITPYEFHNRRSRFESYCPGCLHYEDMLTFSGSPPDRCGLVQFREYFYWICHRHYEEFTRNPFACLPPQSSAGLPKIRPQILDKEIDVEHACWARRLVADGICIVTYADSLPQHVIVPGKRNIALLYDDRLFLFCSLDCRGKFLSRAPMYSKIVIDMSEIMEIKARALVKNLTNLEYLEKTLAEDIIKSVTRAAAKRPKYPGMSPAVSAAVYIGVYLKIHNIQCDLDEIEIYKEVDKRMETRSQIIKIAMKNMKKIVHPYDDPSN